MKKLLLFTVLSVACLVCGAQAGSPDAGFGTGGKVTTAIGTVSKIRAMAIQADGKIVVAGLSHTGSNKDFGVVRYNTDGSLDNSFDLDGKVVTAIGAGNADDIALCMAIQSDGKIVVAGYTFNGGGDDFSMVRYNTDGSLDNSFDGDGKLITSFGASNNAEINAITIQPDGKIVVAGRAYSGTNDDFALARYNTNGSLDNSFDGDGKLLTPIGLFGDVANAVVIQPDGKIVAAGLTSTIGNLDFALARYNSNGTLDNSFDGDGIIITPVGPSSDVINAIALQADGKIVVAGSSSNGSDNDFALARYNTDGSPDNSFDGDGKQTIAFGSSGDVAYAVAMQADGKIVAAGYSSSPSNDDFAVARFNSNGSLDPSFDGDGRATSNINSGDAAYAMKLSGLRIYAGGVSNDDIFTVLAYVNDALPLPLQLTSFTAHKQNNNIILNWQTVSEQNTDHFGIERSEDGARFLFLANVTAAGNSQVKKNYEYTDVSSAPGLNYYRLKEVDKDGKFIYSPVVRVMNNKNEFILQVSPDPAANFINIIYTGKERFVTVNISDVQGKLVIKRTYKAGSNIQLDVQQLKTAPYIIRLTDGIIFQAGKFIKQ